MTLFVLGWCTTLCGLISLRAYPWMPIGADQRFLAAHPQTERGLRLAYEWADQHLDPQVVLQHDPTRPRAVAFALYGRHRVAVADSYGSLFGADPKAVAARIRALAPIFREGLAPADLRLRMVVNGIDALVMTKDDPVWTITNAPIWRVTPLYASDSVRIVARSSLEESTAPPLSATVAASMPSSKDN